LSRLKGTLLKHEDPGDGSYRYTFAIPADSDPLLKLDVLGHTVFDDRVSGIKGSGIAPVWKWFPVVLLLLVLVVLLMRRRVT
jgi:hypothetical protein